MLSVLNSSDCHTAGLATRYNNQINKMAAILSRPLGTRMNGGSTGEASGF